MSVPCSSCRSMAGRPYPWNSNLFLARFCIASLLDNQAAARMFGNVDQITLDDGPHFVLLMLDRARRIDNGQSELVDHFFVPVAYHSLKKPETLLDVFGHLEIHSGLVILEGCPSSEDSLQRYIQRHAKIERPCGLHREFVEVAHERGADAASYISRECSDDVAIRQHDRARFERRHDMSLDSIGKIGRVNQRERRRRQHVLVLAAPGGRLHQRRGIPFAEEYHVAFAAQPLPEQAQLGRFAGAVDSLDYEELSG